MGLANQLSLIYCKMVPCYNCAMRIVRVGVKRVVAQKRYHADKSSLELFKSAGVKISIADNTIEKYARQ